MTGKYERKFLTLVKAKYGEKDFDEMTEAEQEDVSRMLNECRYEADRAALKAQDVFYRGEVIFAALMGGLLLAVAIMIIAGVLIA